MIEKMEFISITGPKADIDRVVDQYLSRYEIHLENALAELNTVQNLSPYLQINPYKPLLSRAEELEALLEPRDTEEAASISLEDAAALVEELDQKLSGLDADKKSLDEQLHRTEELLQKLEPVFSGYDYVFMDLGAGISDTVQGFAAMASMRLVVITPEPTSLTDSYAFMKVLSTRHAMKDFMVVVNQAGSAREAQAAFDKLKGACSHFLNIEPVFLGHVRSDAKLTEAVCRQQPLMRYAPGSPAAQDMEKIAARLQKHRLSMLDQLARRPVLQAPGL